MAGPPRGPSLTLTDATWTAAPARESADERDAAERRLAIVGIAAILAVGTVIRLANVNSVGLNSDEAVYSGQAAALAGSAQFQQFFAIFRAHPLLIQFLLS